MIFQPFYSIEGGCASYLFGCGTVGLCAVVDPRESQVDAYPAVARAKKLRIAHVIETHVHADHRSAGRALAAATGAAYHLHSSADVSFPFKALDDGQAVEMGNTIIRVLHTPGHTPESIALLVTDLRRGPDPWFVLTGDTLFVGAVGRPDLPGDKERNAALLHASIHEKLLPLPGELEIHPAHFLGSACGAGLSGKPCSTLAFEKRWNRVLSMDRDAFVAHVTGGLATPPPEFDTILRFNQGRGP
jgi:hydroxyacylglutathione hydrolase